MSLKGLRTICGTCNADSEEHTCAKVVARYVAALEDMVCLDESCDHEGPYCVARKAQKALGRGPKVLA